MYKNILVFCPKKFIFVALLSFVLMCVAYTCSAQVGSLPKPDFLLKKSRFTALHLYTTGWGVGHQKNTLQKANLQRYIQCSFDAVHHPKEIKTFANYSSQNRPYIYGKLYNFFELQGGGGYQKLVFEKDNEQGVEMHTYIGGGASLGLLQPVYLKIATPTDNQPLLTEVVRYDPAVHFPDRIAGKADIGTGLNALRPTLGLYTKAGFLFDASADYERLLVFDIGTKITYYPKPIAMMAYNPAQSLWVAAYICVGAGKRW
jgi:hypothetical protein